MAGNIFLERKTANVLEEWHRISQDILQMPSVNTLVNAWMVTWQHYGWHEPGGVLFDMTWHGVIWLPCFSMLRNETSNYQTSSNHQTSSSITKDHQTSSNIINEVFSKRVWNIGDLSQFAPFPEPLSHLSWIRVSGWLVTTAQFPSWRGASYTHNPVVTHMKIHKERTEETCRG